MFNPNCWPWVMMIIAFSRISMVTKEKADREMRPTTEKICQTFYAKVYLYGQTANERTIVAMVAHNV